MAIRTVTPVEAGYLVAGGATLIDIRSADEHGRERITGATNIPLHRLGTEPIAGDILVFHCKSGMRTVQHAESLQTAAGERDCYIIEGGISAWGDAGLPVEKVAGAPIEMQRQVMIAAGILVLAGTLLSLWLSPQWIALAIFVGAGLTFAGVTGFCGMARFLARMPWNRHGPNG